VTAVDAVVAALEAGGPVVVPSDTVYGLCVSPHSEEAYRHIGHLKGRADQPVAVVANTLEQLLEAVPELDAAPLARLLPGAYTLIVPNPAERFPWLSQGNEGTLGIRVPDLPPPTREVIARFGPVAATSANLHGGPDPRTLADVPEEIRAATVCLDGGPILGVASTVVDLTGPVPHVLREGAGDVQRVLDLFHA
jgi:tRNA threonylcarbamoyl adenosine modification protein (Sua5/YciO/YrdC/YwlC family)